MAYNRATQELREHLQLGFADLRHFAAASRWNTPAGIRSTCAAG
jgi:hypothetical protein